MLPRHKSKPECRDTDPDSFQAGHFTLHGLWPNKTSCGTHYGFCGKYKEPEKHFCDYDPIPMSGDTLKQLGTYMPSAKHGSCLQRHEWYKHGTCQTTWSADEYFKTAIRLVEDFNENGMAAFMKEHMGQRVHVNDFFKAVDTSFGKDAHRRMKIICKKTYLTDIYINLPEEISESSTLGDIIQDAPEAFDCNCGDSFFVDEIGY